MRTIKSETTIANVAAELPEGPIQGRLAVLVGTAMKGSGLPDEECRDAVARLASGVHGGHPASMIVLVQPGEEGEEGELSEIASFRHHGVVCPVRAVVPEDVPLAGSMQ